jgi:hypothetical protein
LTSEQRRAWPRMGIKQHLACWPWAAQPEMKVLTLAGVTVADKSVSYLIVYHGKVGSVRGAQSKLARLRTSVAQQTGLPELQRPT